MSTKFDCGSSEQYFGKLAPCVAASNSMLMNALLAFTSQHQNRLAIQSDVSEAVTYHNRCLHELVPMLGQPELVNDDIFLITTILLHIYEDHDSGQETSLHLQGTSAFFTSFEKDDWSPLRNALFYVHLRQEVFSAFIHQRPIRVNLALCHIDFPDESATDNDWFHYLLCLAARAIQWATSGELHLPGEDWEDLQGLLDAWEKLKPTTLNAIFIREQNPPVGRWFSEICFAKDEATEGAQFFYLSKILLQAHDPNIKIPRIGPFMKVAFDSLRESILVSVRAMVGIAKSNDFEPAKFDAILAVRICSAWINDRAEQERLLTLIKESHASSGWPGKSVERALVAEWGLDSI